MPDEKPILPQSSDERIAMGLLALIFGTPFVFMAVILPITPMPPLGLFFTILLGLTEELLLASAVVFVLCMIWAVAAPPWVERLFRTARKKMYMAILLGRVPIVLLAILAAFGLKVGAGL